MKVKVGLAVVSTELLLEKQVHGPTMDTLMSPPFLMIGLNSVTSHRRYQTFGKINFLQKDIAGLDL
jgi:hypothetical protein